MRKLLILLPFILLTGCANLKQDSNCKELEKNYVNEDALKEYDKESSIFINTTINDLCMKSGLCNPYDPFFPRQYKWKLIEYYLFAKNDRWTTIEMSLSEGDAMFPPEQGYYSLTKDYTFKNCADKNTPEIKNNLMDDKGRQFCVSGRKIDYPTAKVRYETIILTYNRSATKYRIMTTNNEKVYLNGYKIIETNPRLSSLIKDKKSCMSGEKGIAEEIIKRDFF